MKNSFIKGLGIIIAAGGSGNRFGKTNKLFAKLAGRPLFTHCLANFAGICPDEDIVLCVNPEASAKFAELTGKYLPGRNFRIVNGGYCRERSVYNGLKALSRNIELVAVHDAARPLASAKLLSSAFKTAKSEGSAVVARRVTDTVKRGDEKLFVQETIDRRNLWQIETPQIFRKAELLAAYEKAFLSGSTFTDDAGAMEQFGHKVRLFENKEKNMKITFPEDLREAESYLKLIKI